MIDPDSRAGPFTHEIVASLLDPPDGSLVADFGAGTGNFAAYLEQAGYNVVAIDIDREDYIAAGYASAPFIEANLDDDVPELPSQLGGAVAIEIVEHLESPLRLLRQISGLLAEDGWLIVTTPNVESIGSKLELLVRGHDSCFDDDAYRSNGHISPVGLRQIRKLAERTGLEVEVVTYNLGRIPLPKLRQRFQITSSIGRTAWLGDSLIVKLRKTGPVAEFARG
jgi:SAM-dependent methyltransferase